MAVGILGTALAALDVAVVPNVLFAAALITLIVLVVVTIAEVVRDPRHYAALLRDPSRAFEFWTTVAAVNVVGLLAAALHVRVVPVLALIVAAPAWVVLTYALPALVVGHAHTQPLLHVEGSWFLWVVGTQSTALALANHAGESLLWRIAALALWSIGVTLYLLLAAVTLVRLAAATTRTEHPTPTVWILMGATAVSTLAAVRVAQPPLLRDAAPVLLTVAFGLWSWGSWLIPFLIALGVREHLVARRPLRYLTGLWSIVFPTGMYAVATTALGRATQLPIITVVGRVATWVCCLEMTVVIIVALRAAWRAARAPADTP